MVHGDNISIVEGKKNRNNTIVFAKVHSRDGMVSPTLCKGCKNETTGTGGNVSPWLVEWEGNAKGGIACWIEKYFNNSVEMFGFEQ